MQELKVEKLGENFSEFQIIISEARAAAVLSKNGWVSYDKVKGYIVKMKYPTFVELTDDNGVKWELKVSKAIVQQNDKVKLFCSLVTTNPKDFFAYHVWAEKPEFKEEQLSEVMQEYVCNMEGDIRKVTDDIKNLLLEKNRKYGNQALDPINIFSNLDPISAIRVRIDDKLSRIKNYGISGDGREDTLNDLIGYLILLKIAIKDVKE